MITCSFENGNQAQLRHVTVDAIVVNQKGDRLLLAKRSPKITHGNKWALPGGFLDRGENIFEGISREVKEETGHDALGIELFKIVSHPGRKGEDRQNVDFVFIVKTIEAAGKTDWEVKELKWFYLEDLPPVEEFAFDHYEHIETYLKYKKQKFLLPLVD
ncbi:MAG: NUDIX hydrolase [Planctomycetes bacterium]|jgi:8-oxo-dGTP diphosphatase|nr:NUDIX hydrolase [Planctomycetota bacterium]